VTAYLVGVIDKESGVLQGLDVFSEELPTLPVKCFPFTVLVAHGATFEGALRRLGEYLKMPGCSWAVRHLSQRARETLGLS
jgi:hypothetical protein